MSPKRTVEDYKHWYADRVEYHGDTQRARFVPGGFTPMTAGLVCGVCFATLTYVAWEILGAGHATVIQKLGTAAAVGIVSGVFDYFYTLRGNDRGRWDLVLDKKRGTVQFPAMRAHGEPVRLPIDEIDRLQLKTIAEPNLEENTCGLFLLSVVRRHVHGDDPAISRESYSSHSISMSSNRNRLLGMAAWLQDILELSAALEEVSRDSSLIEDFAQVR